jgi:Fis family transcriptional regulator
VVTIGLYDILKRDIKKMVVGIGDHKKGNIHPLVMQEVEKYLIFLVLQETNNNYFKAAKVLGISRSTLYRKIESFGIEKCGTLR